ncbi:MAG: YceH family protein [Pirellula sp.]|jgi:hypothetical protein|nr:YceH family protein [Pirellula sp.]
MDETPTNTTPAAPATPEWKPLSAKQRRVLGTLMEKSKTTPDAYPMSFSGLMTGCNQKSNRAPITNYTAEQVETIVDELRSLGAVFIIQGSGRVTKVRHNAYAWLGIQKVEGAIMTELLLRGEQTLGELRTRASRMEPIPDLDDLRKIVDALKQRDLIVELSPPGRGQIVSHNLYPEWELESVRKHVAAGVPSALPDSEHGSSTSSSSASSTSTNASFVSAVARHDTSGLQEELRALRESLQALSARVERIESELGL